MDYVYYEEVKGATQRYRVRKRDDENATSSILFLNAGKCNMGA